MLKIFQDVADAWHQSQLHCAAFIPPERAGMCRPNKQKKKHRDREKRGNGPLGSCDPAILHLGFT